MDDKPTNEEPKKDFNKLDLTQLESFSFGTQWTQDQPEKGGGSRGRDERPRRDGPRDQRKDRRGFKRPAGPGGEGAPQGPRGDRPPGRGGENRGYDRADRGERRDGPAGPGGPGGPGRGPGGPRGDRRRGGPGGGGAHAPVAPYISPYFDVTFYPEDVSFAALSKTIRASCRTFELFDIAKTVIGKHDRFVVVVERKPGGDSAAAGEKRPFYVSLPDGLPFESEEAAINHVMQHHVDKFFRTEEVEVDPPKGSFQVINKCGVTGELLGPPNYHLYSQTVQQHHAARLSRMPFETFRNRIETVRDEEVVNAWLESMKKVTRYTWLLARGAPAATAAAPTESAESASTAPAGPAETATAPDVETAAEAAAEAAPEGMSAAEESASAAPAAPALPSFDSLTEAKVYLLTHAREKAVRTYEHGRFHGKVLDKMPDGEIKRAVLGALERQQRFPLDTANALRGRLRREGFTIFKKGAKGVSYVCAVKRKFRVPGQVFADSIDELINYIETHPMVKVSELPDKFLGLTPVPVNARPADEPPPAAPPPEEAAAAETEPASAETESPASAPETPASPAPAPAPAPTPAPAPAPVGGTVSPFAPEDQPKVKRMQLDLRWLVTEGYVTEFIDGSLFAAPPLPEPKPKAAKEKPAADDREVAAESEETDSDADDAADESESSQPEPDAEATAPAADDNVPAETAAAAEAPAEEAPANAAEPAAAPEMEAAAPSEPIETAEPEAEPKAETEPEPEAEAVPETVPELEGEQKKATE